MTKSLANAFFDLDSMLFPTTGGGFPHYDILEVDDTHYVVTLAVAGFDQNDLNVTVQDGMLTVEGSRTSRNTREGDDGESPRYLHRGITRQAFTRKFRLADNTHVTNSQLRNGELTIYVERELPDKVEPLKIEIKA